MNHKIDTVSRRPIHFHPPSSVLSSPSSPNMAVSTRREHWKLLSSLKTTVEGLVSTNNPNVWSRYGGLQRLHKDMNNILSHALKNEQVGTNRTQTGVFVACSVLLTWMTATQPHTYLNISILRATDGLLSKSFYLNLQHLTFVFLHFCVCCLNLNCEFCPRYCASGSLLRKSFEKLYVHDLLEFRTSILNSGN